MTALMNAISSGTASTKGRSVVNGNRQYNKSIENKPYGLIWGKTSTVVDGTNKTLSYGIFLGGRKDMGIIAIMRNSNGHLTARQAIKILQGSVPTWQKYENPIYTD